MKTGMEWVLYLNMGEILACLHTDWNDPADTMIQDKVDDTEAFL